MKAKNCQQKIEAIPEEMVTNLNSEFYFCAPEKEVKIEGITNLRAGLNYNGVNFSGRIDTKNRIEIETIVPSFHESIINIIPELTTGVKIISGNSEIFFGIADVKANLSYSIEDKRPIMFLTAEINKTIVKKKNN